MYVVYCIFIDVCVNIYVVYSLFIEVCVYNSVLFEFGIILIIGIYKNQGKHP